VALSNNGENGVKNLVAGDKKGVGEVKRPKGFGSQKKK